ncbi:hypothetical protein MCGE09_00417 [Thaumarchaeota archaeon SCGC AB-539-E09]|nr:hypothetical protein MCGE09_00417 [Thaumarchaeota archaeon SCGC AB-539-E09]
MRYALNLLPVNKRKRVSRQDCSFKGDYRQDVDDGILYEVQILNEEIQIPTVASCEGHLPYSSAYILGHISDKKQSIFKKYMKASQFIPIKNGNSITEFLFEEVDYRLYISIDGYYSRGFGDGFILGVNSRVENVSQKDWDKIRKTGFQKAIYIIKKAFS